MATGPRYRVEFSNPAAKALGRIRRKTRERIASKVASLAVEPRPHGVEKLEAEEDQYRVRVGPYRIIYTIEDDRLIVLVLRIGHRGDVYRKKD